MAKTKPADVSSETGDAQALLDQRDDDQDPAVEDSQDFSDDVEYDDADTGDEASAGDDETDDSDSGLSDELLDEAKAVYDFSDEDLKAFPTDDALRAAMRLADKRMTAHQQQFQQFDQQQAQQQHLQQQTQPDDDEIDLSDFADDDPTRGVLQKMQERNRGLRDQLQQVTAYIQQQEQREQQRVNAKFRNEGLAALEALDPVLYGRDGQRSPAQQALADEVLNGPYLDFVRSQIANGQDFDSLNLGQFATSGARSKHFEKLTRRVQQKRGDAVRKRAERVRTAASRQASPGREKPEDLHPDGLANNRTLHQRLNAIRNRQED